MKKVFHKIFFLLFLPAIVLVLWELIAIKINNPTILPRAEAVLSRLINPFDNVLGTGSLLFNIFISAFRVVVGFLTAVIIGVTVGLIMGVFALPRKLLSSLIELLRPLCPIAWIPFALVVFKTYTVANIFGIRYSYTIFDHIQIGMLFIIFWGAFFPILLNTIYGVTSVRKIYIESATTLGAKRSQIFSKIIFPAALPSILTGLRIALGIAWMVIIAAEMLPGSDSGIGYLIIYAYQLAEMDVLITGMILIGLVGTILSKGLKLIEDRISRWQAKER